MLGRVRASLLAKLFLSLLAIIAVGFGGLAIANRYIRNDATRRTNHAVAAELARALTAGVRNAMLSGNGIAVRILLDDAKRGMPEVHVAVYSARGEEVFRDPPPAPKPSDVPEYVRYVLQTRASTTTPDGATAIPIENEERCHRCHTEGAMRGVLTLKTKGVRGPLSGSERARILVAATRGAFVQIMTARHAESLDDYFSELKKKEGGLATAAVYSTDLLPAFGGEGHVVPLDVLKRAVVPGDAFTAPLGSEGLFAYVQPLVNEARCQGCHGASEPMRGALVVEASSRGLEDARLLTACKTSLEHVMLAGLGRLIVGFLDQAAATGNLSKLTLHDSLGRLYYDAFAVPKPPAAVARALTLGATQVNDADSDTRSEFDYVEPMLNERRCQRCHGGDLPLRGAIAVTLDRTEQVRSQRQATTVELVIGLGVGLATLFVLYRALGRIVLRPLNEIGAVADQVGTGSFEGHVDVQSTDEIGKLGNRINDMVESLRRKLELQKFVSKETSRVIDSEAGTPARGQRCSVTTLFSDIRGFTSFSEAHEPEQVVEMLNRYLGVQAAVVAKYGGDIDKFVGDALMARFVGNDAGICAVRAAVEMVAAVEAENEREDRYPVHVGVGVNSGDVIFGAIGDSERMDFTVIGDAVNLTARLCTAAGPRQVLVSATTREAIGEVPDLEFLPLGSIAVKGKKQPVVVFACNGRTKIS